MVNGTGEREPRETRRYPKIWVPRCSFINSSAVILLHDTKLACIAAVSRSARGHQGIVGRRCLGALDAGVQCLGETPVTDSKNDAIRGGFETAQ